ncbi:proton myo-inositol cotransporter-like [Stylophora pistillata]|uniref:proton myo-inositol cotransporter-like n=1 Tax=Stylophora pistillata TaxID=50429 RepID=UPI000C04077A|nr:proton myo-inositol cotransporter-like [Stylophora pistillata]
MGDNLAVVSEAMILIKEEFHLSSFWQELIVSVAIGTAVIGAPLGGFLNQRLGRKPMLLTCAMVFTIGAVVEAVATSRNVLLIGRLIVGFGIDGVSVTVPVYIAETAPSNIRGRLATVYNLFMAGAQFVAAVIDGIFSPYKKTGWR